MAEVAVCDKCGLWDYLGEWIWLLYVMGESGEGEKALMRRGVGEKYI